MRETRWNDGWKYWLDRDSFALVWSVPEEAREVTLPHDAMIEKPANEESPNGGNTGFRDGAVYTYVKTLRAPEEWRARTIALKFEGVYMNAFVYVNGQLAGKSPFGYTTFLVPLNDHLRYGEENEIRVQVRAGAMTNSRWYSGAGIYRDVYLLEGDLTHIEAEGLRIKTTEADESWAVLDIATELNNRRSVPQRLEWTARIQDADGTTVAAERLPLVLLGGEERCLTRRLTVASPALWSDETPRLYTCRVTLTDPALRDAVLDEAIVSFGIRTLSVDTHRGLRVNGRTVKLRGGCIHHDAGLLGAAAFEDAEYRKIRLLKEAGFNAVRMSHQPMSPAMLRACDALGMYVMNEAFDMWTRLKSDYDYGLYFGEWWEKDVTAMVRTSYNHPSVILYSVGNEIPEIGTVHGARLCQAISAKIKSLDDTRFTLASINGVFASGDAVGQIVADVSSDLAAQGKIEGNVNDFMTLMDSHLDEIVVHRAVSERLEMACAGVDIAGYNYMTARYEPDGAAYPNRVIVGSETYPPEIARNWALVTRLSYVIGDFTWTAWDYIGEAGVGIPAYHWGEGGFGATYPAQLAYCGDIDLTGRRRPASYYREIVFGLRRDPYIAVQNPAHYGEPLIKTPWVISDAGADWSYPGMEGNPVIVEVYSPGTEVELWRDDILIGRKPAGAAEGFRTLFETTYAPGTLTAISFLEGQEMGRCTLRSCGEAARLVLRAEDPEDTGRPDTELIYINVAIEDEGGTVVPSKDQKLTLSVEGAAAVAGFGSADPKPRYNYIGDVTTTFGGRALIILRRQAAGEAHILIEAEDGLAAELTLSL